MNAHSKAELVVIAAMFVVVALAVFFEFASTSHWLGAIVGLVAPTTAVPDPLNRASYRCRGIARAD